MTNPVRAKPQSERLPEGEGAMPGCEPLFHSLPSPDLKEFPKKLRKACGDAYFNVDSLKAFELRIGNRLGSSKVRQGGQLMRHQGTYQLAAFFLPYLRNPPPGLSFLLDTLRELQGSDKVTVVFENRVGRGHSGWFHGRRHRQEIHLADTLSPVKKESEKMGHMDVSTLYHELGHNLMFLLYGGKIPSYHGSSGHDENIVRHWESKTNPSAAWSEGFAGAIGNLDYHSSGSIKDSSQLFPEWFDESLESRLSNEFVIDAILTEYIKSEVPYKDTEMTTLTLDQASYCRLRKIFATMRESGLQKDFRVFVGDFLLKYPEESTRLNPILRDYGLSELTSG